MYRRDRVSTFNFSPIFQRFCHCFFRLIDHLISFLSYFQVFLLFEIRQHNQFRKQVTLQIDESLFKPLYSSDQGTPSALIRVMISMMTIKEAGG